MKKHGILALVYVEEMSTGVIYSIGLSGRPDDSAAYKAVCAAPENSLFWAEVINTKHGYARFTKLELVLASNEPPAPLPERNSRGSWRAEAAQDYHCAFHF